MPLSAIAARRLAAQTQQPQQANSKVSSEESGASPQSKPVERKQDVGHVTNDTESNYGTSKKRKLRDRVSGIKEPVLRTIPQKRSSQVSNEEAGRAVRSEQAELDAKSVNPTETTVENSMDVDVESVSDSSREVFDYDSESSNHAEMIRPRATITSETISSHLTTVEARAVTVSEADGLRSSLIRLRAGQEIVCVGCFDLLVRHGTVSILGAIIHKSSETYRVYAPSSHALPVIRGLQNPKATKPSVSEISLLSFDDGIRRLEWLNPKLGRLWNQSPGSYQILRNSTDDLLKRPLTAFQDPPHWREAVKQIFAAGEKRAPRTAICGLKGSGKSSFSQYLLNATLTNPNYYPQVAFLDLDPGQPEFSLCGQISVSMICDLNLGPPFTHPGIHKMGNYPLCSQFYGSNTPRDDPDYYLRCVLALLDHYERKANEFPLIINFSGWILGDGLHALDQILAAAKPSSIIYMSSPGDSQAVEFVRSRSADYTSHFEVLASIQTQISSRSSADLRTMRTLSHFHLSNKPGEPLAWNNTPISELPTTQLTYFGTQRHIDGIVSYNEEINTEMLDVLISNSLVCIVQVDNDDDLEAAISSDDRKHAISTEDHNQSFWKDSRLDDDSDVESLSEHGGPPGSEMTSKAVISRASHGLPFYLPRAGEYHTLDPSKTRALSQAYIKTVDHARHSLHIVTDFPMRGIQDRRKSGSRILLVCGRSEKPTWTLLEPYYRGLARNARLKQLQNRTQHGAGHGDGTEEEKQTPFDAVRWAETTSRVEIIDKSDVEMRRRMKPWRTRRNLELSAARPQDY